MISTPLSPQNLRFEVKPDLHIAAQGWGDAERAPVIFLHGGGQTKHSWGDTCRQVAEAGWYAIACDARGHGESSWSPDGSYQLADNVNDLLAVLSQLSRKPAIVGASMGGMTGLLAEGNSTESICSTLILVDIVPRPSRQGVSKIFAFMKAYLDGFDDFEQAVEAVAKYLPHRPKPEISKNLMNNLRQGENGRFYWHWDPAFVNNFSINDEEKLEAHVEILLKAAQNLRVPTLAIRGGMSDVVSPEAMQELLEVAPQINSVDVSDAHHMVAGDSNRVFTQAVIKFLAQHYVK